MHQHKYVHAPLDVDAPAQNMNAPLAVDVNCCSLCPRIHKAVKYICLCVQLALFILYKEKNTIQCLYFPVMLLIL